MDIRTRAFISRYKTFDENIMRICHIMLACFYIEGWSYQENLLPKFHKKMGNDVFIISSRFTKDKKNNPGLRNSGEYINADGIQVSILDYGKRKIFQKLLKQKVYKGVLSKLENLRPDIIFVHGCQFYNIFDIISYKREYPNVKIFVDQHGDYYNMPVETFKQKFFQRVVIRHYAKSLLNFVDVFWGVTPWRVDYLRQVYKLPNNKTDLLVMGGDDTFIDFENKIEIRKKIRKELGLLDSDLVLISGGKMDRNKNIHLLLEAISFYPKIKLILFGSVSQDLNDFFTEKLKCLGNVIYLGWENPKNIYDLFLSSDFGVFPGTHSILWEQAVACGLPLIVKDWVGMHHVDIGGNCEFLENDSINEIRNKISIVYKNEKRALGMKKAANNDLRSNFLYSYIARRSIMF